VVLLSVKKLPPPPYHHHTETHYNLGSSRQPRKLIFGMKPYFNPNEINMEDELHFFENGRQAQLFQIEDDLIFFENVR
jgi:hypothetical protein